jgi:hypothetical protein
MVGWLVGGKKNDTTLIYLFNKQSWRVRSTEDIDEDRVLMVHQRPFLF